MKIKSLQFMQSDTPIKLSKLLPDCGFLIEKRFLSAKGELTLAMKCMSMCSSFVIIYFFLIHVRLHSI